MPVSAADTAAVTQFEATSPHRGVASNRVLHMLVTFVRPFVRPVERIAVQAIIPVHAGSPGHARPSMRGCSGHLPGPPAQTHVVVDILLIYRAIRIDAARRCVRGEVEIAAHDDEPEMFRNQT